MAIINLPDMLLYNKRYSRDVQLPKFLTQNVSNANLCSNYFESNFRLLFLFQSEKKLVMEGTHTAVLSGAFDCFIRVMTAMYKNWKCRKSKLHSLILCSNS